MGLACDRIKDIAHRLVSGLFFAPTARAHPGMDSNPDFPPSRAFYKLLKRQSQEAPCSQESQAVCTKHVRESSGIRLVIQPLDAARGAGRSANDESVAIGVFSE